MAQHVMTNFVKTTLRSPITPTDTVLPLAVGAGLFFNIPPGDWCYLTINDSTTAEVVKYTSAGLVVGDNITVIRGLDGTTAKAFPAGSCVTEGWNVAQVTDFTTRIFNSLIGSVAIPANTIALTSSPVSAPPAGVIYAININTGSLWYFSPPTWIKIQSNAAMQSSADPGSSAPPDGVTWWVNTTTKVLWFWTGSGWISVGGGSAGACPQVFAQGCNSISPVLAAGDYPFRSLSGVTWVNDLAYVPSGSLAAMHFDSNGYFHFDHDCIARFSASFQGLMQTGQGVDCQLNWTHSVAAADIFGGFFHKSASTNLEVVITTTTLPFSVGAGDLWDANITVESGAGLGSLILNQIYRGVEIIALL